MNIVKERRLQGDQRLDLATETVVLPDTVSLTSKYMMRSASPGLVVAGKCRRMY